MVCIEPNTEAAQLLEKEPKKKKILEKLFKEKASISVKPISPGHGGASLFFITPKDAERKTFAPFAVKIGDKTEMKKEYGNFKIIEKRLHQYASRIADIAYYDDMAGISYTKIGGIKGGVREFEDYYQKEDTKKICQTIEWLLKEILDSWYGSAKSERKRMRKTIYNQLLPTQLTIEADFSDIHTGDIPDVEFDSLASLVDKAEAIGKGICQKINIESLEIIEKDKEKIRVTDSHLNSKIDIKVNPTKDIEEYELGTTISLTNGRVVQTRNDFLREKIEKSLTELPDEEKLFGIEELNKERLIFDKIRLPNPLYCYSKLLDEQTRITLSLIHGDLNLGNILLDRDTPWLIDYAKTQEEGHTAFDFAKLETEIKTHILAEELDSHQFWNLELELWRDAPDFNKIPSSTSDFEKKAFEVISKIREIAKDYLLPDINQYFYSLFFYSLATLKFGNLNAKSKTFAFVSSVISAAWLLPEYSPPEEETAKPKAPEDFVGREDTLRSLDENFKQSPLVVVYGIGGIGKTHIRRKYCSRLSESTQKKIISYEIPKEGFRLGIVLNKLVEEIGRKDLQEKVSLSLDSGYEEGAINLILRALEAEDYFLCLDDFHKIEEDDAVLLFSKLSKGLETTQVLILSRNHPNSYRKDGYKPPGKFDSISLSGFEEDDLEKFVSYLKNKHGLSELDYQDWKDKLKEISKKIGRHPRTISDAAKLLEKGEEIDVQKLSPELKEARSRISKSIFRQLEDDGNMLLSFLSVFERRFSQEAIKWAPDIKGYVTIAFENLKDWDIVKEAESGVYKIHDTIKSIVRSGLTKDRGDEIHKRCGEYLSENHRSLDDKMEAVFHFCESNNPKQALKIIENSSKKMKRSGRIQELMELLHMCLDKFIEIEDIEGELKLNFYLGEFYSQQRKEEAEKLFKRNIQLRKSKPVTPEKALDFLELGRFYTRSHRSDEADKMLTKGLKLAKQTDDLNCNIRAYYYLGRRHRKEEAGLTYLKEAESKLPDKKSELAGEIYSTLGESYSSLNQPEEGRKSYKKAVEIFKNAKDWYSLGRAYNGMGLLYHRLWNFDKAIENYQKNIELTKEKLLDPHLLSQNLNLLSEVYRRKGDKKKAHKCLKKSLRKAEELIDDKQRKKDVSYTKLCLANLALDEGRIKEAEKKCLQAEKSRPWMERTFLRLYRVKKDFEKAEEAVKKVVETSKSPEEETYEKALDFLEIGLFYKDREETSQAEEWLEKALNQARKGKNELLAKEIEQQMNK